jgi:hypothetical protein
MGRQRTMVYTRGSSTRNNSARGFTGTPRQSPEFPGIAGPLRRLGCGGSQHPIFATDRTGNSEAGCMKKIESSSVSAAPHETTSSFLLSFCFKLAKYEPRGATGNGRPDSRAINPFAVCGGPSRYRWPNSTGGRGGASARAGLYVITETSPALYYLLARRITRETYAIYRALGEVGPASA